MGSPRFKFPVGKGNPTGYYSGYPCCCGCKCCAAGQPQEITVTISGGNFGPCNGTLEQCLCYGFGITCNGGPCFSAQTTCLPVSPNSLNGTYLLQASAPCTWSGTFSTGWTVNGNYCYTDCHGTGQSTTAQFFLDITAGIANVSSANCAGQSWSLHVRSYLAVTTLTGGFFGPCTPINQQLQCSSGVSTGTGTSKVYQCSGFSPVTISGGFATISP